MRLSRSSFGCAALCAALMGPFAAVPAHAAPFSQLNDTGLTQCVVYDAAQQGYVFTDACAGTGQDGEWGRDVTRPNSANGRAGFSFTKIGAGGESLPKNATTWSCVNDKVTGLTWEVKTDDGGPRDKDLLFTNQGNRQPGDASSYVASVNAAGLCGASDWRLPTRAELESLLDYSVPYPGARIDSTWFPNSPATLHWSSTSAQVNGGGPSYFWVVSYLAMNSPTSFEGAFWYGGQYGEFSVRLVREGRPQPQPRWVVRPSGDEVQDKAGKLVWRRCAEGQTWSGSTCSGTPTTFLTMADAIEHAQTQKTKSGQAWRLPNAKELSTLVNTRVRWPAIDSALFPGFTSGRFHTSTSWPANPVFKWFVDFSDGGVYLDYWGGVLLLVRDVEQ